MLGLRELISSYLSWNPKMSIATKTSPTNKELSGLLREAVNRLLESGASTDDVGPIDEAARRLEFGYTPPEEPPPKTPLELKREEELHVINVATATKMKALNPGGIGIFGRHQNTCDAFIFTSQQAMQWFESCVPKSAFMTYPSLSQVNDLHTVYNIIGIPNWEGMDVECTDEGAPIFIPRTPGPKWPK